MAHRFLPLLLLGAALAWSQQSFEVASIRPNAGNDNRVMFRFQPGGLSATGVSLKLLMMQAYRVKDFQITGGPGWVASDRWDVNAKSENLPERVSPEILQPMIKSLLANRFQLKVHTESREAPGYALVLGKGPHKMKAAESAGGGERRGMFRMGRGQATLQGANMAQLAEVLSQHLGRPVIDRTGLDGAFDIELHWTPEPGRGGPFGGPPPAEAIAAGDASGPTLLTAVQEQLGLKLESAKGQIEIIVIDSVSKPSEN